MSDPFEQETQEPSSPARRVPPHSSETEQAVLSAWSLHERFGKAWRPEPELFYLPNHRAIADAMAKVNPDTRDFASVVAQLDVNGSLAKVGGSAGAFKIINGAPAYGDPWPHVSRLREYKALRDVITLTAVAAAEAYEHKNLGAMVAKLQEAIRVGSSDTQSNVFTVAEMVRAVARKLEAKGDPSKVSTGLPSMDDDTGGFQHQQVSVFGAGTSWGKSSYAVFVADNALTHKQRPLIVSFEDSEELYGRRLLARRAEVSPAMLRNKTYKSTDAAWSRIGGAAEKAEHLPFFINAVGKTVERIATDVRCVCASDGIDLVIVDYLQAIQCSKKSQDRRTEVTYVARMMTDVIKSSGATGLMFSQFKRAMKAGDKPTMHDLKESGDLENAAEMVLIGYLNSDGERIIRTEKCKDGIRNREYQLGWSDVFCGFTAEVIQDDGGRYQ